MPGTRGLRLVLVVGALLWLGGCRAPAGVGPERLVAVEPPPGLPARLVRVRQGDALERARMTLPQVLAALDQPEYLAATATSGAGTQPARPEPPPAVQRLYLRARAQWRQGQAYAAIAGLEAARQLAPRQAQIVRLLGLIHLHIGNRARGEGFLAEAFRLDPTDLDSLFLLARQKVEEGDWPHATAALARALPLADQPEQDPALAVLVRHYLGTALERQGHDAAAVEQFTDYLSRSGPGNRTTRLWRELGVLHQMRDSVWVMAGDARHRLGRPALAAEAYARAWSLAREEDKLELAGRLVYTHLCLGQSAEALAALRPVLERSPGDRGVLTLVGYLARHTSDRQALLAEVRQAYEGAGRPQELATALADLLPRDLGLALLEDHLKARPGEAAALRKALDLALTPPQTPDVAGALRLTLASIEGSPAAAGPAADALLEALDQATLALLPLDLPAATQPAGADASPAATQPSPREDMLSGLDRLLETLERWPAEGRRQPATRVVAAMALLRAERPDAALAEFEAAAADPRLIAPRLAWARMLIGRGEPARAEQVLAPLAASLDAEVVGLRSALLARLGRPAEALRLTEQASAQAPRQVELLVLKAAAQVGAGDALGAEQALLQALAANPTDEALYSAALDFYRAGPLPDADRAHQRLLRRAMQSIPLARVTRFSLARDYFLAQQWREAERLLRSLLAADPRDYAALEMLLSALHRDGRSGEAFDLLAQQLGQRPVERDFLRSALRYLVAAEHPAQNALAESLALLEPRGPARGLAMARVYLFSGRPAEAARVLQGLALDHLPAPDEFARLLGRALIHSRQAERIDPLLEKLLERHPAQRTALLYEWGMICGQRGQNERAEALLAQVLTREPGHDRANNALGYMWADRGLHLAKARGMIARALEVEPNNAAYLDSMGWVLYKLGQSREAVPYLLQAVRAPGGAHAVVLDHLADALYVAGEPGRAQDMWKLAQESLSREKDQEFEPDLQGLDARLTKKLQAVAAGKPAPVAQTPELMQ